MDELERQLKIAQGVKTFSVYSPFTKATNSPREGRAIMLKLSMYDRRRDPYEHLTKYESVMTHFGHDDVVLCRLFTSTLKDSTNAWFQT